MSDPNRSFLLPDARDLEGVAAHMGEDLTLREEAASTAARLYLDTFDWRLHARGGVLCIEDDGDHLHAIWQDRAGNELARTVTDAVPRRPQDLPPGAVHDAVAPALKLRALLPLAHLLVHRRRFAVLNGAAKTVARLLLEAPRCHAPDPFGPPARPGARRLQNRTARGERLSPRLTMVPVKGYGAEGAAVEEALREAGLEPAGQPLFAAALAALGRAPGHYSSKINVPLEGSMRADAAARRIHLHLLDSLEANIAGTRAGADTEFLHDLRVATRRTRSALTQIKRVFPPAATEDFKARFAWLGRATGPTRDLDVFLLGFEGYRTSLPPDLRADLDPFHAFLVAHQREEQQRLRRRLDSPHFRTLIKEWRTFLEAPLPGQPEAGNALRPAKAVADARIWKMFRRVIREGRAIHDDSPHEDIHELRKSCKKLRYLIEFFRGLYPAKAVKPLVKALKSLLDNLGEFQDLEVQARHIEGFAEQMAAEGEAPPRTLVAMGALIGNLRRRQVEVREAFEARFTAFDSKANRRAYRALFKPGGGDG